MRIEPAEKRQGAVLPLVTICLVGLLAFVALAIDIGMIAVARTHAQAAADVAALAAARTLDGKSTNNNRDAAVAMGRTAATNNKILNAQITTAQVTSVQAGIYRYDETDQRFQAVFNATPTSTEAYGVVQVTISTQQPTFFARVMGANSYTVNAVATAIHRPRDVAIVLDFSGSMKFASEFGYRNVSGSLNPDPRFPRFGPWSIYNTVLDPNNPGTTPSNLNTYVPPTPMQRVFAYVDSGGETHAANNLTISTRNGPPIVDNFVLSDNTTNAFTRSEPFPVFTNVNVIPNSNPTYMCMPAPDSLADQGSVDFVGDKFPLRSGVTVAPGTSPTPSQYAHTVADYLGIARSSVTNTTRNATFETYGYDWDFTTGSLKPTNQRFQGFTMGPGYVGKTFYMWPPDPRAPVNQIGQTGYVAGDWRRRFFLPRTGSTQDTRDNSMFWNSGTNGRWKNQSPGTSANYMVNYDNVLAWLKRGPQTLPTSLRSGRVVYYDSIPDTIPVDNSTGLISSSATNDQRFWKDYIDYVLGAGRYSSSSVLNGANTSNVNGSLRYNNPSTTTLTPKITTRATLVSAAGTNPVPYMRYDDNPVHPRLQFWFGPTSMLGYLGETGNWFSGATYEAQCWQLKAGINAALTDIQNNHPNDLASLIYFSGITSYKTSRVTMGKDYVRMKNALFFPHSLLSSLSNPSSTIRPYSTTTPSTSNPSGLKSNTSGNVPNAEGSTCPEMGFKVAFNEMSSVNSGTTVFKGRRGAIKMVIFETDGVPNTTTNGSLVSTGTGKPGQWYYSGISSTKYTGNSTLLADQAKANARAVVRQIVASDTANPPGYSTQRNPARVHALGFGELFEATTVSTMKEASLRFLAAVQIDGKTSPTPSGSWDNDSLDYVTYYSGYEPYKVITGDYNERIDKIRSALERIMQGGLSVALIQ